MPPDERPQHRKDRRINLRLSEDLLARFTFQAIENEHLGVSELIRELMFAYLDKAEEEFPPPEDLSKYSVRSDDE